jgi:LuxR family maltose regulon positive regulatory protein
VIPRTHLIERLNAGLSGKVTLLSAPTGFGKTTLLVKWLETRDRPMAWLSLDENDNELSVFVHYLTAALQTIFPDACQGTVDLLSAPTRPANAADCGASLSGRLSEASTKCVLPFTEPDRASSVDSVSKESANWNKTLASRQAGREEKTQQFPSPDHVAILFTNDLADLPEDIILVLDNYHTIHNDVIHTLLDLVIRYIPPQLHLVLASRSDPPLPLAQWRAQGQLNEFHAADLRFTRDETEAFLARLLGDELPREVTRTLEEQTEGWVAMLRLAALSLRGASNRTLLVEDLRTHPDRYVSSYLVEEILAQQAPATQELLLRMSILDQFCPALSEAIIGNDDVHDNVQAYLNWLERANAFIVPLDDQHGWFRFHPLFRRFLEQRLQERFSQEKIAMLHRRASSWYATQGLTQEAIEHTLAAGDLTEAAHLVEARLLWAIQQEQWAQMERWLHLLPEDLIQGRPGLLVARAWILEVHGLLEGVPRLLTAAEQLIETSGSSVTDLDESQIKLLRALIALSWSLIQHVRGQTQASLQSASSALQWVPPGEVFVANLVLHYQALSNQLTGNEDVAHFELNNALREQSTNLNGAARLLFAQASIYLNAGKLQQVEQTSRHLLRLAQDANLAMSQYWAHWLLGYVHYEWNQLNAAEYHFSAVVTNVQSAHRWTVREAMYGLALVYQAQGLRTEAKETTDDLLELLRGQNNICDLLGAYSFQAQLELLQDEVESAVQWVEMVGEQWVLDPMTSFEVPPITKAWMLLARGDELDIAQGQKLLATLLRYVESIHNTRKTIQVLALQALAYDLQDCVTEALDALEHAIALAYPGGFIRTFANLPPLVRLLQELRKRRKARQTIDRKLDAYLQRLLVAMSPLNSPPVSKEDLMRQEGLEPLTDRELQILYLLDKDLTNKEIARRLVVTAGTVKVHTNNVYRKLSVNNRRSAVALSKALGILTAD